MKKPILIALETAALAITTWLSLTYFEVQKLFIDERVDEALPTETTTSTNTTPRAPQKIAEGNLVRLDSIHYGKGAVQLLQTSTEEQIIRFDNVTIGNGPDLYVYVSDSTEPTNDIKSLSNYANLGKLKGNIGNQNYTLPSANELGFEPRTVIVWCKRFEVLFTYAVLK